MLLRQTTDSLTNTFEQMSSTIPAKTATYAPPSWPAIQEAHARIAPRIHRTAVLTSVSLDAIAGAQFFFKC